MLVFNKEQLIRSYVEFDRDSENCWACENYLGEVAERRHIAANALLLVLHNECNRADRVRYQ
jgi:hypothetical protein